MLGMAGTASFPTGFFMSVILENNMTEIIQSC